MPVIRIKSALPRPAGLAYAVLFGDGHCLCGGGTSTCAAGHHNELRGAVSKVQWRGAEMDLRHLRYFVGIADCGSLLKASQRLHVAQPSLTVHISNLEVELGVKLMHRSHKGISLTEAGERLYKRAHKLLDDYHSLVESVRDDQSRPNGFVSVGIGTTSSPSFARELHNRVSRNFPDITLYLAESSTAMIYEWLMDGRVDFSILFNLPDDESLVKIPLHIDEYCLVSHPDCSTDGDEVDFKNIFDLPLVLSCKSTTWRKILDDIASNHGKVIKPSMETESFTAIREIVKSGDASGILPLSSVQKELNDGTLKVQRLINPEMRGIMSLARLPSSQLTPTRRVIQNLIIDIASDFNFTLHKIDDVTPMLKIVPSKLLPAGALN